MALKALREEGMETVLIKPSIDTVQISEGVVDQIYSWPVRLYFVERMNEIGVKPSRARLRLSTPHNLPASR